MVLVGYNRVVYSFLLSINICKPHGSWYKNIVIISLTCVQSVGITRRYVKSIWRVYRSIVLNVVVVMSRQIMIDLTIKVLILLRATCVFIRVVGHVSSLLISPF